MTVEYQKVWTTMNDLEMVTSKICSAREIIDNAIDKIQEHQNDKAELLMNAAYEFLEYYLQEFDDKFKLAWQATVGDLRDGDNFQYTATGEKFFGLGASSVQYTEEELNATCDKEAYDTAIKEREHYEGKSWNSFWESYYPEEPQQYTEKELNAMCDAAEKEHSEHYYDYTRNDPDRENPFTTDTKTVSQNGVTHKEYLKAKIEANSAWNDGWTREYYQKIVDKYEGKKEEKKSLTYDEAVAAGWEMTDDGFWMPPQKETVQTRWILPVQEAKDMDTDETEYFVSFPQDLLEAADLKEGDAIHWIDNNDGSYTIRKPLGMDEC